MFVARSLLPTSSPEGFRPPNAMHQLYIGSTIQCSPTPDRIKRWNLYTSLDPKTLPLDLSTLTAALRSGPALPPPRPRRD